MGKEYKLILTENESLIKAESDGFNVALDFTEDYAAEVGKIISLFAVIERYHPKVISKICNLGIGDATAVIGVFRAFSNRNDVLKELARRRSPKSLERECLSYYLGLFTDANKIRNKYAHATYSWGSGKYTLITFSGDFNKIPTRIRADLEYFRTDATRLRRIACELHAVCERNEVSAALQKTLSRLKS